MDTENENNSDTENIPLSPSKLKEVEDEKGKGEETISICWSPRFEFDAPKYTNFCSKKYRETGKLLNRLILSQEDAGDDDKKKKLAGEKEETKVQLFSKDDIFIKYDDDDKYSSPSDSDSIEIDEWFNRSHPLHEPLRPMTPPGPLISPERTTNKNNFKSLWTSPLKLDFSKDPSASMRNSPRCELNTPSKGPNTRIGLRSKPARVLKSSQSSSIGSGGIGIVIGSDSIGGTSISSSPSSLIKTNFSNNLNNNSPNVRSPIRNLNYTSPIKQSQSLLMTTPTKSSVASPTSSLTLSVSSLTKHFYDNDHHQSVLNSPIKIDSPLKMKSISKSTIARSFPEASPLRKDVGIDILQIEEEKQTNPKKRSNPVESKIAPVVLSKPTSPATSSTENSKKQRPFPSRIDAELADIKKLLSQHNSRLRPNHQNNKRKT